MQTVIDHPPTPSIPNNASADFEAILRHHHRRLWFLVRRYVHNHFDAEEVLQEALLKASEKISSYRGEASLHTWLHRLVANTAYDFVHRNKHRPTIPLDTEMYGGSRHQEGGLDLATTSAVRLAMRTLPQEQRRAIYLVDFVGVEISMAAAIEGVQPGTMKSRRSRARAALRERLAYDS
ncbi:sigma-70 family RNA polymerase sigma factor [Corynebacterium pseudopelargi]|uniref:sigma-70 family RNA polymerase sigma factor n=1 Tax=Corynebacterium pseudopelargi TaxID=2080757 RepID=UPI0013DE3171|nr:sigma-70 family RNA polymerase sigma factor [Corynebacterium pseudopelargi]